MNAAQAIQAMATTSDVILTSYISDLEGAELLRRPHAGCNPLAWQLGHLVLSEISLLSMLDPEAEPVELPEGFAEKHDRKNAGDEDPAGYCTKEEYLDLFSKVRAASAASLAKVADDAFDAENPVERMRERFPTLGSMWVLTASHPMMHVGQFVPVRRELGKPVVI